MKNQKFYARYPVFYKNSIIFSSNNALYEFNRTTKQTKLILQTQNDIKSLIANQNNLIFLSEFEGGPDLYHLEMTSKKVTRLTFSENAFLKPIYLENDELTFISSEHSPNEDLTYVLNLKTKEIKELPYHGIFALTKSAQDIYVQKSEYGYLFWKNYKGGTRGQIYKNGKLLINLPGQAIAPMYHESTQKIFFIYEEDDDTNIFSCNTEGQNLKKHTNHTQYKIKTPCLQNNEITYSQVGSIYVYNIESDCTEQIDIDLDIIQPEQKQKLSTNYITSIETTDEKMICAIRGNILEKKLYSGGFKQLSNELRYTHTGIINNKIFGFKDGRETALHIFETNEIIKYSLPSQKIENIAVSKENWIAFSNHKGELSLINETGETKLIAKSDRPIKNFEWNKDGKWMVYELSQEHKSAIIMYSLEKNLNYILINDCYHNTNPSFDTEDRFIVFLSNRNLKSKMEEFKFDYSLSVTKNVYYIPLKTHYNMLTPWNHTKELEENFNLENLQNKINIVPINYKLDFIIAIEDHLYGTLKKNQTLTFSLKTLTEELSKNECEDFFITNNKKNIITINDGEIKVKNLTEKTEENNWKNIQINFQKEYSTQSQKHELENLFDELTWYMEEFFWSKEKTEEFKHKVQNYKQFLDKANTPDELYSILKQIQGEMKTSHSYICTPYPKCSKGYLGINIECKNNQIYIKDFIESKTKKHPHPIISTNQNLNKEIQITKINNTPINTLQNFNEQLLNQGNKWITLSYKTKENEEKEFDLKPMNFKEYKRYLYENWIQNIENYITNINPEIGYIHIKDMSKEGFVDFFTQYINVFEKKSIIIDVRYNSGGHTSTLLLEQLAKKKTGIDKPRHFKNHSIPHYTTEGNYVLLINSKTASDGEIFAENFKKMNLGTVIGERTWGGVVGIWPRYHLINNLTTTQPEFATCFSNSVQEIENYGVTPDIEIINPIDEKTVPSNDAQLNKAIELCLNFQ